MADRGTFETWFTGADSVANAIVDGGIEPGDTFTVTTADATDPTDWPAGSFVYNGAALDAGEDLTDWWTSTDWEAQATPPDPTVPVFPDFTTPAPPPAGGYPPPPTFPPTGTNHTPVPVPVGPVAAPEPVVPAAVPPSVAGITQPQFGAGGSATVPAPSGLFPQFKVVLLSPPLQPANINAAIFNLSDVPPFVGGTATFPYLPTPPPTTPNPALPILTTSAVATIPQLPGPAMAEIAMAQEANGAGAVHSGNSRPSKRRRGSVLSENNNHS